MDQERVKRNVSELSKRLLEGCSILSDSCPETNVCIPGIAPHPRALLHECSTPAILAQPSPPSRKERTTALPLFRAR